MYSEIVRNINLLVPVRLTITKTNVPNGTFLLNPNLCNLRSYPIQKALSKMSVTLNAKTFQVNLGDCLSALEHFNTSVTLKQIEYSKCPTYGCCQAQKFSNLPSGTRSELALYADSISGIAPQNFPFTVVSQTNNAGVAPTGTAVSVVEFVSCESIWLSPLYWGNSDHNYAAISGIYTMDFQFDFLPNAGFRMIAIDNEDATLPLGLTGTTSVVMKCDFVASDNFSYSELRPKLLIQLLQPEVAIRKDLPYENEYYQLDTYKNTADASVVAAAQITIASPEMSFTRLPTKFWIFARKPLSTFLADPFTPDCFMAIENLSVQWNTRNCLSTAHKSQLYDISVRNGLQMDYTAWSGMGINTAASADNGFGTSAEQYSGTGSVVCLDALDLGLSSDISQNMHNQIQMQVTATFKNISVDTFTPELVIVVLTDGLFRIHDGLVETELGVLDTRLEDPIKAADPTVSKTKGGFNNLLKLLRRRATN